MSHQIPDGKGNIVSWGAFLLYDKQIIDGHLVLSKGLQNRRVAEIKYFLGVLQ